MAINFPTTPTVGQTLELNGKFFVFDGSVWKEENYLQNVIQYIKTGTQLERPIVTAPTLYYNTDLGGLELYYPDINTWEVVSTFAKQVDLTEDSGQIAYTSPGTYSFVCPANVYQVHAICVGAGGSATNGNNYAGGGGGGGLAWLNNIPVIPGNSYTVQVGANTYGVDGGNSFFVNSSTVCGFGGKKANGTTGGAGGSFFTTAGPGGGGFGGNGGSCITQYISGGGGGAGGYSGNGGAGGNSVSNGSNGSGGGGGGGGGANSNASVAYSAGAGGGVGILGEGASGAGGLREVNSGRGFRGGGGSGGVGGGVLTNGGEYGGGGGGTWYTTIIPFGAPGAVRLIWGPNRAFPSTNTGDV
jgi:hypothetical protein